MSISNLGQGQGSIRWNTTPPTLKPALVNGEGWWTGAAIIVPTQQVGSPVLLYGYDASASGGNNSLTDGGEVGLTYTKSTTTTSTDRRLIFLLRGASSDVWVASGLSASTTTPAATRILVPGEKLWIGWGVYDSTGSGGWLMFRTIVDATGAVILNEVQAATGVAIVNSFATSTHQIYNHLIHDVGASAGDTTTGNGRCSAGFAIEHVACVKGKFPFAAGVPDATVLAGLFTGGSGGTSLYTYADGAVLNGGTILSWYKMRSTTDLTNFGSDGSSSLVLQTDPGGSVANGSQIMPWSNMSITELLFDGYVYSGLGNSPEAPVFAGTKRAAITAMEGQIELQNGTVIQAWSNAHITLPSSTTWTFSPGAQAVRLDGQDYVHKVRNANDTTDVVTAANAWAMGIKVFGLPHDQSQASRAGDYGGNGFNGTFTGSPGAPATNNMRVLYCSNTSPELRSPANLAAATFAGKRITSGTGYGSAYVEAANMLGTWLPGAHPPLMVIDCAYTGQPIDTWVSDAQAKGQYWHLWSEYATGMARAAGYRIDAFCRMAVLKSSTTLGAAIASEVALLDTLLVNQPGGQPAEVWIHPPLRYGEPDAPGSYDLELMRNQMVTLANSGGRYFHFCDALDIHMCEDATIVGNGHHPAVGLASEQYNDATSHLRGNRRWGRKMGIALSAMAQRMQGVTVTLTPFGPKPISARFTDGTKTAFKVTFDKAIKARDGSTSGIRQCWTATSSAFSTRTEETSVAITGSAEITVTGTYSGNPWFDVFRDSPFPTNATTETAVRALLDKCLYGTDSFDDGAGTGLHATPIMNTGIQIQDASSGSTATAQSRMSLGLSMGLS